MEGPIYAVQWIEVEFGQRPEGWALFTDVDRCISETKKSCKNGRYAEDGGYYGPVKPLRYHEIPVEGLTESVINDLKSEGKAITENEWSPKYLGKKISIDM